ncbi:MAG: amino acid permease, partial [Pirellulaceae bacterium]
MNADSGNPAGPGGPPSPKPVPGNRSSRGDDPIDDSVREVDDDASVSADQPTIQKKVKTLLVGKPLDLGDRRVYQHISLVAFLAWVGLGADGLSSSCYGPSEAFAHLYEQSGTVIHDHRYLAVILALATVFTVLIISFCYSFIIEAFPSGGGGYLVASKMLGSKVGALSGCALVVDYVLTVTVSIAAAGDALFGLLGPELAGLKLPVESVLIIFLIVLNLRGVKESIQLLMPIFLVFLATHIILILGVLGMHVGDAGEVTTRVAENVRSDLGNPAIGLWGIVVIGLYAYSLTAGTYTGIEAVSNSMAVMREPRVATAQRTMIYMAFS